MSKLYDTPFKVGFGCNILAFAVINAVSYLIARHEAENASNRFYSVISPSWGFPTEIYTLEGLITGGFIIAMCGFVCGFLSKAIWADIRLHRLKKK